MKKKTTFRSATRLLQNAAICFCLLIGATQLAHSASITDGLYILHSHPDGNQNPPPYGLRLDELFNPTGGHDVFTFDFDHASSLMQMTVSGGTIHIFGSSWGGRDTGAAHAADQFLGLYDIDFTYTNIVGVPGDDDLWAPNPPNHSNSGSIIAPDAADGSADSIRTTFNLVDEAGSNPFTFRLGDENSDLGHRGFPGISGWGWLSINSSPPCGSVLPCHTNSQDWLFTATPAPVPEPGSLLLIGTGLAGLARLRRRRAAKKG